MKKEKNHLINNKIIEWYRLNKRDLPWRKTKDPYKIWVSEIILQQTRIEQGKPYYSKFLSVFPSIFSLATSEEEKLLHLWQGLGYYNRARNMHKTSKILVESNMGVFPNNSLELSKLPGIGKYTSAAIASFAFNEKIPVVDGNVYRLISRVEGEKKPIDDSDSYIHYEDIAKKWLADNKPSDFNQGMMDIGSTICLPKNPKCNLCPLQSLCIANNTKTQNLYPVKNKKIKTKVLNFNYLVIENKGEYLIQKRSSKGIWPNLYEFPLVETEKSIDNIKKLESDLIDPEEFIFVKKSKTYTHLLSHRKIRAVFWHFKLNKTNNTSFNTKSLSELNELGMPILLANYITENLKKNSIFG